MRGFKVYLMFAFIICVTASNIFVDNTYMALVPCENNDDCVSLGESKCENDLCVCNSSTLCHDKSGTPVTKIGEICNINEECHIDKAECKGNKCTCKAGYVKSENGKKCLKISKLGDDCEDSAQCFTEIQLSGCRENRCVCQQHTHEYNGSCYRDVELDQNCNNSAECAFIDFSECVNTKCMCIDKYVASSKATRCLPIAESFGSSCVDDAQCTNQLGSGSECLNGKCDCKEMYQFKNKTNKCVVDKLLGEFCEKHIECHDPFRDPSRLECILGECKCKSFYREVEGYCISSSERLQHSLIIIIFHLLFVRLFYYN